MITLTAKIDLLSGNAVTLTSASSNVSSNNISSEIGAILGVKKGGSNPFLLGSSPLGSGATLNSKVDYYIGTTLSNENGEFIYLSGEPISAIGTKELGMLFPPPRYEGRVGSFFGFLHTLKFTFTDIGEYVPYEITNLYLEGSFVSYQGEIKNYSTENSTEIPQYEIMGFGLDEGAILVQVRFLIPMSFANDYEGTSGIVTAIDNAMGNITVNAKLEYFGYEFVVCSNSEITSLTIAFDTVNNKHPNKIYIDDIEYIDDDAIFTIANLQGATSHKISIVDWNTPNSPLVITGIYADITIEINHRNMISIERTIMDRGDIKNASWGIISNTGRIEFNDLDGEVQDYIKSELLVQGLSCVINLHDTLAKNYQQVAQMYTDTWDYDNLNRVVSVTIKDDLEEWQDIQIAGFSYNPLKPKEVLQNGTMAELYGWLQNSERTPSKYKMPSFNELDEETKTILNATIIEYPMLKDGSLWEQWQKLCEVCALYIYKNNKGEVVCKYSYGD